MSTTAQDRPVIRAGTLVAGLVLAFNYGAAAALSSGGQSVPESGTSTGAPQIVGKVDASIPEEVVQQQGSDSEVPLRLGEIVGREDVIRTLKTGRVRLRLLDGSSLDLGAQSTLEITRHDPESQQTQVELIRGHLRGRVTKPSKPDARFLVRTPTAVIRLSQAVFLVEARTDMTEVCAATGSATVRNANVADSIREVTLHPGQCTRVTNRQSPSDPGESSTVISAFITQTDVTGPSTAEVADPDPVGRPPQSTGEGSGAGRLAAAFASFFRHLFGFLSRGHSQA